MSPMTLILPAIAYLVLSAALGLTLGPALGLAAFGAAAGAHGLWLAARATETAEDGKRALAQIRRELGAAREEARGILEAIEDAARTRPDLGHVMTEVRVLQGLVEQLSGQPLPKQGLPISRRPSPMRKCSTSCATRCARTASNSMSSPLSICRSVAAAILNVSRACAPPTAR